MLCNDKVFSVVAWRQINKYVKFFHSLKITQESHSDCSLGMWIRLYPKDKLFQSPNFYLSGNMNMRGLFRMPKVFSHFSPKKRKYKC